MKNGRENELWSRVPKRGSVLLSRKERVIFYPCTEIDTRLVKIRDLINGRFDVFVACAHETYII